MIDDDDIVLRNGGFWNSTGRYHFRPPSAVTFFDLDVCTGNSLNVTMLHVRSALGRLMILSSCVESCILLHPMQRPAQSIINRIVRAHPSQSPRHGGGRHPRRFVLV